MGALGWLLLGFALGAGTVVALLAGLLVWTRRATRESRAMSWE